MPEIYKSTDASAPVLSGTNGTLVALLKACLTDGYGSKAAAGWTTEVSPDGLKGAFTISDVQGSGCTLLIDDSGSQSLGARVATGLGIRSGQWTGFDGSSNPQYTAGEIFPTAAQCSWGSEWSKSSLTSTTARDWVLVADSRTFYLFVDAYGGGIDAASHTTAAHYFGDLNVVSLDYIGLCGIAGNTYIAGNTNSSLVSLRYRFGRQSALFNNATPTAVVSNGVLSNQEWWRMRHPEMSETTSEEGLGAPIAATTIDYPIDTTGGGVIYQPKILFGGPTPRYYAGKLRGLYATPHHQPYTHGQQLTGVAGLSGRTLEAVYAATSSDKGQMLFDLTGPW